MATLCAARTDAAVDAAAAGSCTRLARPFSTRPFPPHQAVDICDEVTAAARSAIVAKGSFSICIPGGSVVAALGQLPADAFDFSKMHVFFANEKIPTYPCLAGALEVTKKLGVPDNQVHGIGEGSPAETAASYTALLKSHPSIDNSGVIPSVRKPPSTQTRQC